MKTIFFIISYLLYPLSFLFPRSGNRLVFGSFRGAFTDNSKYLFIDAFNRLKDKHVCWLSINRHTVRHIRSIGLPAHWVLSPVGIWMALRARYWYVNAYTSDILFCLSGGATVVNLWHGVGLKRCEFNITSGPLAERYVQQTLKERFYHPESFRRPDYLLSSTPFQSEMFAKAFRLSISQCLNLGYPRNNILLQSKENILRFADQYEGKETLLLINRLETYRKVYIYMPTWRESQRDIFLRNFDLQRCEDMLARHNALLLLKPHFNTKVEETACYKHILLLPNTLDVYCLLPFTDVLITDYSSVLYDYLLIPGKDVILYLYDMEEYVKDRDFYYPFDENVAGKKVYDFNTLLCMLDSEDYAMNETGRKAVVNRFWGDTMEKNVCIQIYLYFHFLPTDYSL